MPPKRGHEWATRPIRLPPQLREHNENNGLPTTPNEKPMKNSNAAVDIESVEADPLLPRKLDLSKAVRGKYYDRIQEGTNVVSLPPT